MFKKILRKILNLFVGLLVIVIFAFLFASFSRSIDRVKCKIEASDVYHRSFEEIIIDGLN